MSSIFSDDSLHPGRDANDSSWLVLRRPEDWAGAVMTDVVVDPGGPALVLAPMPGDRVIARGSVIVGPIDGRTDELAWHRVFVDAAIPAGAAIEVQTFASDEAIAPAVIPWAPARPVRGDGGVAGDEELAWPVISDHGRWARQRGEPYHRTSRSIGTLAGTGPVNAAGFAAPWPIARRLRAGDQIELRTASSAVERPIAAIAGRAIRAVVRGDLAVYGAGARLVLVERAGEEPLGGPRTIAVFAATDSLDLSSAADDATLYDLPASHAIAAFVRDGDVLRVDDGAAAAATIAVDTVPANDATIALAAAVAGNFSTSELRIVAAADRLIVDALDWIDDVPGGEPILVHDDLAGTAVAAALRFAERDTFALWLAPGPPIPYATWTRFTLPEPIATDRGRYLWLRLRLLGAVAHLGDATALAGPVLRSVRLLLPRLSMLRYLPEVYGRRDADDPTGALFLERLLALPEARLTAIEATYESIARELNPAAASPDWLRFVAAWYGLAFDPSWPLARRRALVVAAPELFARRGTLDGIRRYLEIYLGTAPAIVEGFQWRIPPPPLLGGPHVLGTAALGAPPRGDTALAHHFSIWVFGDAGCPSAVAKAARAIIDSVKPAHTTYDLHVVDGSPRVGIASSVGVDMVLVSEPPQPPLGPGSFGPWHGNPGHHPPTCLQTEGLAPPSVLGSLALPSSRLDDDFTFT